MNTSAPAFLRACRTHSSRSLVLRPSPASSSARAAFYAEQRPLQCPKPSLERRARFSTSRVACNAQPVNDLAGPSSTGQETKGSDVGENIPSTVISRATTDIPDASAAAPGTGATATPKAASPSAPSSATRPPPPPPPPTKPRVQSASTFSYRSWTEGDLAFVRTTPHLTGRVTRTGTMRKTVRVSRRVQVWDGHLQKHYTRPAHALVHDPDELLVEGDVVTYGAFPPSVAAARAARGRAVAAKGKGVAFTVFDVVTPFGSSVEQRLAARAVGEGAGEADVDDGWVAFVQSAKAKGKGKGKAKGHGPGGDVGHASSVKASRAKARRQHA